jgi:hypothetical protein
MTISALNTWRKVYLAEALLAALGTPSRPRCVEVTLIAGAALWLMHDLAHGRWHIAVGDSLALAGCLTHRPSLTLAGVAYAVANPEAPPSPFIWRRLAPRGTS